MFSFHHVGVSALNATFQASVANGHIMLKAAGTDVPGSVESRKDRRDDFLCRLLFRYPASHLRVTAVARKDPGQSHSAKSAGGS